MPDSSKKTAGSPSTGEPVFLAIGRLRSAHGVHGEITMEIWTDFPERIKTQSTLYLGEDHVPVVLTSLRRKDPYLLVGFEGFEVREEVNALRNNIVYIQSEGLPPLPAGRYYHRDLIGLQVMDENNHPVGPVREILVTGANDVLVIDQAGKEMLLPFIPDVILSVDIRAGEIKVRLPKWE